MVSETVKLEWDPSGVDSDAKGIWDPNWSSPVFPLAERDRRWGRVRELMARDNIDVIVCLPDSGRQNRGAADAMYLTQLGENQELVTVVFPLEGDVVAWQTRPGMWPTSNWGIDIRRSGRGYGARVVTERLREMGFTKGTIGISGLTSSRFTFVRQGEGLANWQSVELIKEAFPEAKVVSATSTIADARYQKSAAEIDFLTKAVRIAELNIQAVRDHARAGVPEREVFAHMQFAAAMAGGSFPSMVGWTCGPLGKPYHRVEQPAFRNLQDGDIISGEIEGRWGGYVGRSDQSFYIGRAPQDYIDGMKLTIEAFNRVKDAMKPGVTVGELLEAGHITGMNGRGEASLVMHGSGTGDEGPLVTGERTPEMLGTPILENCCLLLKPSCRVDGKSHFGNWGDTVWVRANGAERLGARPQEVYELY